MLSKKRLLKTLRTVSVLALSGILLESAFTSPSEAMDSEDHTRKSARSNSNSQSGQKCRKISPDFFPVNEEPAHAHNLHTKDAILSPEDLSNMLVATVWDSPIQVRELNNKKSSKKQKRASNSDVEVTPKRKRQKIPPILVAIALEPSDSLQNPLVNPFVNSEKVLYGNIEENLKKTDSFNKYKELTVEQHLDIEELAGEELSNSKIAEIVDCDRHTVSAILKKAGISAKKKLTEEQKDQILELGQGSLLQREIADEVGCSGTTVRKYLKEGGILQYVAKPRLTKEQKDQIVELAQEQLVQENLHLREIANKVGCNHSTVDRYLKKERVLRERRAPRLTAQQKNKILDLGQGSLLKREIADEVGCSGGYVGQYLNKRGIRGYNTIPRLTKEQKAQILELGQENLSQKAIAKKVGCCRMTVGRYLKKYRKTVGIGSSPREE